MAAGELTMHGPYGSEYKDLMNIKDLNLSRSEMYFDNASLSKYTPFISNHGLFVITRMPLIMEQNFSVLTAQIQKLLMGFVKSVDGFQNLSLDSDNVALGNEGSNMRQDLKVTGLPEEFTITLGTDFSSLPLSKFSRLWLFQIYNPYTGRAYGKNIHNLRYSQANHTMEAMVITCNPSYNLVEDVAVLHNVVFGEAKFENLNFATGEEGVQEWSMPIKAKMAQPAEAHYAAAQTFLGGIRIIWAARESEIDKSVAGIKNIISAAG